MSDEAFIWLWIITGWVTTTLAMWECFDDADLGTGFVTLLIIVIDGAIVGPFGFLVFAYTRSNRR
jgi:hypothetical protein